MKRSNKVHGAGFIFFLFGSAGIAENITSGRGSFMFCAVVMSVGIAMMLVSYTIHDKD